MVPQRSEKNKTGFLDVNKVRGGYQVKDAVKAVVKDPAQAMQVYSDGVKTRLTNMQNAIGFEKLYGEVARMEY